MTANNHIAPVACASSPPTVAPLPASSVAF